MLKTTLKVHFGIHSLSPHFFSKKVDIFTLCRYALRYALLMCKNIDELITKFILLLILTWKINTLQHSSGLCNVWYTLNSQVQPTNWLEIWKSTYFVYLLNNIYKNSILGLQNGSQKSRCCVISICVDFTHRPRPMYLVCGYLTLALFCVDHQFSILARTLSIRNMNYYLSIVFADKTIH